MSIRNGGDLSPSKSNMSLKPNSLSRDSSSAFLDALENPESNSSFHTSFASALNTSGQSTPNGQESLNNSFSPTKFMDTSSLTNSPTSPSNSVRKSGSITLIYVPDKASQQAEFKRQALLANKEEIITPINQSASIQNSTAQGDLIDESAVSDIAVENGSVNLKSSDSMVQDPPVTNVDSIGISLEPQISDPIVNNPSFDVSNTNFNNSVKSDSQSDFILKEAHLSASGDQPENNLLSPSTDLVSMPDFDENSSNIQSSDVSCDNKRASTVTVEDEALAAEVVRIAGSHHKKVPPHEIPGFLGRYSPSQVVAVTGGASPDLIRSIESDFGEEDVSFSQDDLIGKTGTPVTMEQNTSCSTASSVRHRGPTVAESSETGSRLSQHPLVSIDVKLDAQLTPRTPEEVDASSALVFGNFMSERYKIELRASVQSASNQLSTEVNVSASVAVRVENMDEEIPRLLAQDPVGRQLSSLPRAPTNSVEAIVARNLAEIGDEINRLYGARLDRMIKLLPVDECPVEMFHNVARVLFTRGPTNWGQVITLFYFGYRLVIQRVRNGIANAFQHVCQCLINFCRRISIFGWIAQQGGWKILQFLRFGKILEESADEDETRSNASTIICCPINDGSRSTSNNSNFLSQFTPWLLTTTSIALLSLALWIYFKRSR